jgi:hypothetical protein
MVPAPAQSDQGSVDIPAWRSTWQEGPLSHEVLSRSMSQIKKEISPCDLPLPPVDFSVILHGEEPASFPGLPVHH